MPLSIGLLLISGGDMLLTAAVFGRSYGGQCEAMTVWVSSSMILAVLMWVMRAARDGFAVLTTLSISCLIG